MDQLFQAVWGFMKTPMTLPWIGTTSPLMMGVYTGVLSILIGLWHGLIGAEDDD